MSYECLKEVKRYLEMTRGNAELHNVLLLIVLNSIPKKVSNFSPQNSLQRFQNNIWKDVHEVHW